MKDRNVDIVRYMIENNDRELNMLSISKAIGMDYKTVFNIIMRLEKGKIVTLRKFGRSSRVELNKTVHPLVFEAEYARRKELLKNKNILVMLNNIKKGTGSSLYTLLLFGSYAKRTQTAKSDIDIMFIVPDGTEEKFEKNVQQTIRLMPLPMHSMVFSESQFLDMVNAKGFNVGKEAVKNNVVLHGIENYYEMIIQ